MSQVSQSQVLVGVTGQGLVSIRALKDEDGTLTMQHSEVTGFWFCLWWSYWPLGMWAQRKKTDEEGESRLPLARKVGFPLEKALYED